MANNDGMTMAQRMRQKIKESGSNQGNLFYLKTDQKTRVRFLSDLEDAITVLFHNRFVGKGDDNNVQTPCLRHYKLPCPYDKMKGVRTREQFAFAVWDYEGKKIKVLFFAANENTPIPHLVNAFEGYGTLLDRDYNISRNGSDLNTSYSVLPLDKARFRLEGKVKPPTKRQIMEMLKQSYKIKDEPEEEEEEYDDEYEEEE